MRRMGSALVVGLLAAACGGTSSNGDAGDGASSSSVAEPAAVVEATTPTVTDEPTTVVEATTPTVTDEPSTRPSGDGEWVQVAVDEPWVGSVVEIAALPGGGYVAVIGVPEEAEAAERAGSSLSTVMWSPDGVDWFDGDPEREIEPPSSRLFSSAHRLAVASDRVVVVEGTDFSDHLPLAIGDPRTGTWDVVALEYAALDGRSAGVSTVNLAASDDEVLVAAYSVPDDAAEMIDVVTWVVDPTTGASTSNSFAVGARLWETHAPLAAWVDGHWILIEDMPGREQRNALWTSSDGRAWSQADLPDSMGGAIWLAAGQQGVAASNCTGMGGYGDAHDAYWFSTDGLEWTTVTYGDHPGPLTAVGEYGFVLRVDSGFLQLLAVDGSEVYHLATPVGGTDAAASSGDTLLVLSADEPGLWLHHAVTLTPVEWSTSISGGVAMIVEARPLDAQDVAAIGASLIWEETTITLCSTTRLPADPAYITIREAGDGYVHIGDIFGLDERPDMEEAAANHGPPNAACIYVATGGTVHEYCAPLAQASD